MLRLFDVAWLTWLMHDSLGIMFMFLYACIPSRLLVERWWARNDGRFFGSVPAQLAIESKFYGESRRRHDQWSSPPSAADSYMKQKASNDVCNPSKRKRIEPKWREVSHSQYCFTRYCHDSVLTTLNFRIYLNGLEIQFSVKSPLGDLKSTNTLPII